jgi:hypothetical protein
MVGDKAVQVSTIFLIYLNKFDAEPPTLSPPDYGHRHTNEQDRGSFRKSKPQLKTISYTDSNVAFH